MLLIRRWYNILTSYKDSECSLPVHDLVPGSKRSRSIADETSGKQLSLHELGVQGDGDVVPHQNSAGLKGSVPGQTEILAIDLGARRDPNPGVPPGILGRRRWPFHRKAYFASHSPDREVA